MGAVLGFLEIRIGWIEIQGAAAVLNIWPPTDTAPSLIVTKLNARQRDNRILSPAEAH